MAEIAVETAELAKKASRRMACLGNAALDRALRGMRKALLANKSAIMAANGADLQKAGSEGVSQGLLARLNISEEKFSQILAGVDEVASQEGLAGRKLSTTLLDDDLVLEKISVPLGVVFAIFEARPDALVQISVLAVKTGNAVILKGGSEALETNRVLVSVLRNALAESGLPENAVQLLESRGDVAEILALDKYIDVVIPRGSASLVNFVRANTKIPVLGHSEGICHCFVDERANMKKAVAVCVDAKCQYPAACNSMETLLVHRGIAEKFLPLFAKALSGKVELRCCSQSAAILRAKGFIVNDADESDWATEYADLILSIKVVGGTQDAIEHINRFGSRHTDSIITEDKGSAERFLKEVDSSSVMWNASTRFADGYRYGLGAEVGISTGKLHSRGPGGAECLLTYKYLLRGKGQTVADYSGEDGKKFLHRRIP